VLRLDSQYFGDEVTLVFEDSDGDVSIVFSGCTKVYLSTSLDDRDKPLRDMLPSQIPYFMQDIDISESVQEGKKRFNCRLALPPLDLEICCNLISVTRG
jgi:hypothetical protein